MNSPAEDIAAFSRAVVQGPWCFVSGITGVDPETGDMPESAEAQARNCFSSIEAVLDKAGFALSDVVRAVYYLTADSHAPEVIPVLKEKFDAIRPAATLVVSGLPKPNLKVEIEVTALKSS
nr:RidA family protein [uncultured Ruegeria sp.]